MFFSDFNEINEVIIPSEIIEATNIKKISCDGTEVYGDGMTYDTNILGTFKGGILTDYNISMKYDLTSYLSGTDFSLIYQYTESYMKTYLSNEFDYEGVTFEVYDDNPYMIVSIAVDLAVIEAADYEELQLDGINKNVTISEFKKVFEKRDYVCE